MRFFGLLNMKGDRESFLLATAIDLVASAFSPDIETALCGSVTLAQELGVPTEKLLLNHMQVVSYFMD